MKRCFPLNFHLEHEEDVDKDGFVIDGTTTKQIPASDIKTYASGSSATKGFAIAAAIVFG